MNVLLGFDPGGDGTFGWAACEYTLAPPLPILATGIAGHAQQAVSAALAALPGNAVVVGAGIDAPLFWAPSGDRLADRRVRHAITLAGAPYPAGTVQHINSLSGACLVEGITCALALPRRSPPVVVTESHPKALLWLLGIAHQDLPAAAVAAADLAEHLQGNPLASEHERDAAIGALSAWAAISRPPGWLDLCALEPSVLLPAGPVVYFLPDPEEHMQGWWPAA